MVYVLKCDICNQSLRVLVCEDISRKMLLSKQVERAVQETSATFKFKSFLSLDGNSGSKWMLLCGQTREIIERGGEHEVLS